MIEKLKKKIFYLVFISLSIIILGVIILFTILNYHNTIDTAVMMINRMTDIGENREFNRPPEQETMENKKYIEGIYHIRIKNNMVTNIRYGEELDETIEQYALDISKKNSKNASGIIGRYIYNTRKMGENTYDIIFMENENAIIRANSILLVSVILSILSILSIYIIGKKISKTIVKPVEETFEKQKQFISDASHELKTPLAVIEANADVLENEVKNNKWIQYIQNEIESMNTLINELLTLTKIENIDNMRELKQINLSKELEIICSISSLFAFVSIFFLILLLIITSFS